MAYRIRVGGLTVECDDVAEVAALISRMTTGNETKQSSDHNGSQPSHEGQQSSTGLEKFYQRLAEPQRQVLRAIARAFPKPVDAESLAQSLHIEPTKMGWERRRMAKTARDCGVDLDRLSAIEKVKVDDRPRTAYVSTSLLRAMLEKMDAQFLASVGRAIDAN